MSDQGQALKIANHNYWMFSIFVSLLGEKHPKESRAALDTLTVATQRASDEIKKNEALWDAMLDLKRILEVSVPPLPPAPGGGESQKTQRQPWSPALVLIPGGKKD